MAISCSCTSLVALVAVMRAFATATDAPPPPSPPPSWRPPSHNAQSVFLTQLGSPNATIRCQACPPPWPGTMSLFDCMATNDRVHHIGRTHHWHYQLDPGRTSKFVFVVVGNESDHFRPDNGSDWECNWQWSTRKRLRVTASAAFVCIEKTVLPPAGCNQSVLGAASTTTEARAASTTTEAVDTPTTTEVVATPTTREVVATPTTREAVATPSTTGTGATSASPKTRIFSASIRLTYANLTCALWPHNETFVEVTNASLRKFQNNIRNEILQCSNLGCEVAEGKVCKQLKRGKRSGDGGNVDQFRVDFNVRGGNLTEEKLSKSIGSASIDSNDSFNLEFAGNKFSAATSLEPLWLCPDGFKRFAYFCVRCQLNDSSCSQNNSEISENNNSVVAGPEADNRNLMYAVPYVVAGFVSVVLLVVLCACACRRRKPSSHGKEHLPHLQHLEGQVVRQRRPRSSRESRYVQPPKRLVGTIVRRTNMATAILSRTDVESPYQEYPRSARYSQPDSTGEPNSLSIYHAGYRDSFRRPSFRAH